MRSCDRARDVTHRHSNAGHGAGERQRGEVVNEPDPLAVLADAVALLREQLDTAQRRTDQLIVEARSRADDPLIRDLVATRPSPPTWPRRSPASPTT
jgi:hypothetical protein